VSIVLVEHSIKGCFSVFTYGFSNSIYVTICMTYIIKVMDIRTMSQLSDV
jgi:hypothetical protein